MNKRIGLLLAIFSIFTVGALAQTTNTFPTSGNVGIGTTTPSQELEVSGGNERIWNTSGLTWPLTSLTQAAYIELSQHIYDDTSGLARIRAYSNGRNGFDNYGQAAGLAFQTSSTDAAPTTKLVIDESGNVGIGTTTPGATLEVNGSIKLTANSGGTLIFPDGTTQTTAFIASNCGADYAESVGVSGTRAKYEPGDVLIIDPKAPGEFLKANQPYSTLVAGVYSTKPGFVGRLHPAADKSSATEIPMAMVGRVPTKVSAENGPIQVGDLLVASSTPGLAMKGTDHSRMLGAVIGKALGSLQSGTGTIMVLITLQ